MEDDIKLLSHAVSVAWRSFCDDDDNFAILRELPEFLCDALDKLEESMGALPNPPRDI